MMRYLLAVGVLVMLLGAVSRAEQPNIVMIVADDLGWADLGCYGNKFNETPNIDRLATEGIKFTQFYALPVCSPTRASIQSGEYPARFGLTAHIPGHWKPFEKLVEPPCALAMPHDVYALPQALKDAGYATGHFGKWHLGGKGSGPGDFGYDEVFEFVGHAIPGPRVVPPHKGPKRTAEYIGDRAVAFIQKHKAGPFFLHLAHSAVHIPLTTTPELLKKYDAKPKVPGYRSQSLYAGVLEEMDTSVGRVLEELKKEGLEEKTIGIFVSDNGGLEREVGGWPGTTNRPLRSEKGTLYEGGIRVPLIVRWPGVTKAASISDAIGITTDFYPTLLEAAGVKPKAGYILDGISLAPVLKDPSAKLDREAIYWHYPHYHHSRPSGAIRMGDFKAIEFFDTGDVELYNITDDLSETKNLAKEMPEKVAELRQKLKAWRHEVNAQMPQANPAYDPKRVNEWWSRAKVEPTEKPGPYHGK
jgi:uncharacterized sulfatase